LVNEQLVCRLGGTSRTYHVWNVTAQRWEAVPLVDINTCTCNLLV